MFHGLCTLNRHEVADTFVGTDASRELHGGRHKNRGQVTFYCNAATLMSRCELAGIEPDGPFPRCHMKEVQTWAQYP